MNPSTAPSVLLEFQGRVAFLTLARPEHANTMNLDFGREFLAATMALERGGARAVVLSGQGRNFCFGGDLRGMSESGADVRAYLHELTTNLHAGMAQLAALDAPVIAAVNGTAAGAGLGLVLMADLVIAARSARFAPAYTGVGLAGKNKVRFVTATSLFDGHDASVNIMRRMLQASGAEVIHLGSTTARCRRSSTPRCRKTCRASPITSYQGGHVEFFKYMIDLLRENGRREHQGVRRRRRRHRAAEIRELMAYGVTRLYSPRTAPAWACRA
jgi:methylmalonyl-CoA mutase cobalamin-binding subunit